MPYKMLPLSKSETFIRAKQSQFLKFLGIIGTTRLVHSIADSGDSSEEESAIFVQKLLRFRKDKPTEEIERALDLSGFKLNHDSVLQVLRRHRNDWRPAFVFFHWACKAGSTTGYTPSSDIYNQILDILGRTKRFEELNQVFDEMSKRNGLVNEETFRILLSRHAAAHKVEEAIDIFYRMKHFGMELDLPAFQALLVSLCRYKHVEDAETLFRHKVDEFAPDIKTWNVILNGWCVLGNVREAKRFWKDIVASRCMPDVVTYGTFIKALTKKGKLGTALKLFRGMWDEGMVKPDVVICNCIIDALCFKKRIPEALEVFQGMSERGCHPNVATYNCLIKYMCKIGRMEKVDELVNEMLERKGSCMPDAITYSYLLKSVKEPEEIPGLLKMMESNGCAMDDNVYNLVLRLYMGWDDEVGVRKTWEEMEKLGRGPDKRSYTIMIHGHHGKGRTKEALRYFKEMTSKGLVPEPRTEKLINP